MDTINQKQSNHRCSVCRDSASCRGDGKSESMIINQFILLDRVEAEYCNSCADLICLAKRAYEIAEIADGQSGLRHCFFDSGSRRSVDFIISQMALYYYREPDTNPYSDNPYDNYRYYCLEYIIRTFNELALPRFFQGMLFRLTDMAIEATIYDVDDDADNNDPANYLQSVDEVENIISLMISETTIEDLMGKPDQSRDEESVRFLDFLLRHSELVRVLTPTIARPLDYIQEEFPCLRRTVISLTGIIFDWQRCR